MKPETADTIIYMHCDLQSHHILVKDGRLSDIVDWENSGWLPLHWQLQVPHYFCRSTQGLLHYVLNERQKGIDESEAACAASFELLYWLLSEFDQAHIIFLAAVLQAEVDLHPTFCRLSQIPTKALPVCIILIFFGFHLSLHIFFSQLC
jgi:hypothetical protein